MDSCGTRGYIKAGSMKGIVLLLAWNSAMAQGVFLTPVGEAAAVHGLVKAQSPAQGHIGRVLSSGQSVFLNETITTDAKGTLQIMLLDRTAFMIGPNSSIL